MHRVKRWMFIVGGLAAAYAAVNVLLIGGHVWRHRDDRARLETLAEQLEAERGEIERMEEQLGTLTTSLDRTEAGIQQLGFWIRNVETQYPNGVPSGLYGQYSATVDRYNGMIRDYNATVAQVQALEPGYSAMVDAFNRQVEEANALAVRIGDVPHLLPVDLPHGPGGAGTAQAP
jgi:septal ring factor EnvC (AmiA/AmiB activator)